MLKQFWQGLRMIALLTVLTGLLYPALATLLCQSLLPWQANGSLIERGGVVVGSALIGQRFSSAGYFHARPSAAGSQGYDGLASGGSNLGPTSRKLAERVAASLDEFRRDNPTFQGPVPADLLTASGSGLDPHISPASAEAQAPRVARARGLAETDVRTLVVETTEERDLHLLGEPRVNVLRLNLKLDELAAHPR